MNYVAIEDISSEDMVRVEGGIFPLIMGAIIIVSTLGFNAANCSG